MKKIILFLVVIILTAPQLRAQDDTTINNKIVHQLNHKNLVKINLFALALKNITVQYEREISKKTTIASHVRMMPKNGLPFESSFRNAISDQTTRETVG